MTSDSRDEQEVAGYAETTELIFQSWEDISLTENHIKQLHSSLLKYSDKDEHHRGRYKTTSNNVVAYDQNGQEIGIIFETTPPFQTAWEMERLVNDTNEAIAEKSIHGLLAIGAFVVRFLRTHPFQDGNGRLSRILTTLLLLISWLSLRNLCIFRIHCRGKQGSVLCSPKKNSGDAQQ